MHGKKAAQPGGLLHQIPQRAGQRFGIQHMDMCRILQHGLCALHVLIGAGQPVADGQHKGVLIAFLIHAENIANGRLGCGGCSSTGDDFQKILAGDVLVIPVDLTVHNGAGRHHRHSHLPALLRRDQRGCIRNDSHMFRSS